MKAILKRLLIVLTIPIWFPIVSLSFLFFTGILTLIDLLIIIPITYIWTGKGKLLFTKW